MIQTNYLVIGSGIAGLTFAIKIAERFPNKQITIITKSSDGESNTKYAQGGIAVVVNQIEDSYEKHIQDTLLCGDGLCIEEVVRMVVTEGPKRLQELIDWGAKFDTNAKGNFDLGREGGHTENRVVHHKDQTGFEIERTILAQAHSKKNIHILDYHFALELITHNNQCLGAYALNEKTNEIISFHSDYTLLATGGIGQIYGHTTNPTIATGDGIAMAYRVKAKINDMEFIQFHPTALYSKNSGTTFLISEAVRGFGALLRTKNGNRFMSQYDKRGDLASRDIVSQSIEIELKKSGDECVYLDCTAVDAIGFQKHFPMIYEHCKNLGIDISKNWIPVQPAQHYLCGGISVNLNGQTSIENLFACGECSRTGLHGANRLASNSLLEALVYSERIVTFLANYIPKSHETYTKINEWKVNAKTKIQDYNCKNKKLKLQLLMRQYAGIVRTDSDLLLAKNQLEHWENEFVEIEQNHKINKDFYELKNMIGVARLVVEQSIVRNENRGGFLKH
ncbi:L-aspartate oxidase [Flavobacterium sp.]|uniref:L-aspartate oxidase n=1 Tax=Flavobacterium sp. TaxID=239 RepID=UPI0024871650|nr:L-aspartate oxidase [Flavobacterium sp.]MDI1317491.1 L-aspartate oxidase [Flavobacterium sp.]